MSQRLRCITYLAPGLPRALFQGVVEHLAETLGVDGSLEMECRVSGPAPGPDNPLEAGRAELGWMCTPSYLWSGDDARVSLVPAAMVFADPRNGGRPHYYSDVVVRRGDEFEGLSDLRDRRWTYNDANSQSGYYNLLQQLAAIGEDLSFFREVTASGSHLQSLERIARGTSDAAAIDSNVLAHQLQLRPDLRDALRVMVSWGPHTIQPMVAGAHVRGALLDDISGALLAMHESPHRRKLLLAARVRRFVPIDESSYVVERAAVSAGEELLRR